MFHIIDDQKHIAEMIGSLMHSLGYQASVFTSPEAYLEYVASPDFKLPKGTITDVDMPNINGYEMMMRASSLRSGLRFTVVTSEPKIDHEFKPKACMYLTKPFRLAHLKSVTDRMTSCAKGVVHTDDDSCTRCDNRNAFAISGWECPHLAA